MINLSIVISVYNAAFYPGDCLASILSQLPTSTNHISPNRV